MALDKIRFNKKRERKNLSWVPDVFEDTFTLPDTPFVVFAFKDLSDMRYVNDSFTDEHRGVVIFISEKDKKIYTSRIGKDTARLMLDFVQQLKKAGEIEKGVKVSGINEMP